MNNLEDCMFAHSVCLWSENNKKRFQSVVLFEFWFIRTVVVF